MRAVTPALLLSLSLAVTAGAQETPPTDDPIGALLQDLPPDQTTDIEDEAAAPQALPAAPAPALPVPIAPMVLPPPKQDPAPPPAAAYAPPPPLAVPRAPRPTLDRPVMIDETGRSPDGPPTEVDIGYESRLRASFQSAQGLQGPLDGGWTVRAHDGTALYGLQLVDRGDYGPLEGAWRLLNGSGKLGLIDSLDRQPTLLTIRITRSYGKQPAVLTLSQNADGSWVGDLNDESGTRPVTMKRN